MAITVLEQARRLVDRSLDAAVDLGIAVAVAVVDAGGRPVFLARMDGAPFMMGELAIGKAECAVGLGLPTGDLQEPARPDGALFGLNTLLGGRVLVMGGGIPLRRDGVLVAALGVSGGTTEQDLEIARRAHEVWEETR